MRTRVRGLAIVLALAAAITSCSRDEKKAPAPAPAASPPDARALFDGNTLTGWRTTDGKESWGVEEGGILALKLPGEGHVATVAEYGDFELRFEFRLDSGADSGLFLRWPEGADPMTSAIEVQISDGGGFPKPLDTDTPGALAALLAPTADAARPGGEWNQARVVCEGPHVRVEINGKLVLDADLDRWTEAGKNPDGSANRYPVAAKGLPRKGRIGFENGRFFAWYREIWIRPLTAR